MRKGENMKNKNNIDEILDEGFDHLEKGNIKKAQECYLKGLGIDPDNLGLINNLAQTYALVGDTKQSKAYHQKLIELCKDDESIEMLMLKANSLMNINNFTEALEIYEKIIAKTPNNTSALFQISSIYMEKGEFEKSNKYLNRILSEDEDNIVALIDKATNYFNMERYGQALRYYDKALSLSPKHEIAIRLKGELLKQRGDAEALKTHIEETLKIKPDSPYTLMLKAMEFANEDNDKKAFEFFNRAIAIDPFLDEAYFNKAGLLMLKKRYDEAIECYKKAFEINPESGGIVDKESLFELLHQMKNSKS